MRSRAVSCRARGGGEVATDAYVARQRERSVGVAEQRTSGVRVKPHVEQK